MKDKSFKEKINKLLKQFDFRNQKCWRCGKKFYHGFTDLCNNCYKDIRRK